MRRVVYLGNFQVPFSTESHLAWTWAKLGWQVTKLQENQISTQQVVAACKGADLFQWSHTHGWNTPGFSTDEMVIKIRAMGVPSFSYHLDLYWGLNQLDQRENKIGEHASWKLDYFFSTDGSDQPWASRGVNHIYLPPGVVEYGCFKGDPNTAYDCEVGFAGSVGYHPEYPFRRRMVEALQKRYGKRFKIFGGVREKNLNDLCASVKVMVGDHCFAGRPRYWSDRVPEICGRNGFLLHPETEGLCIPTATYKPQDIGDLVQKVDYYLEHEIERQMIREQAFLHVKEHDTYTIRLQQILQHLGL